MVTENSACYQNVWGEFSMTLSAIIDVSWKLVENTKFMYNISFCYQYAFLWQWHLIPSGYQSPIMVSNMQNKSKKTVFSLKNFQIN